MAPLLAGHQGVSQVQAPRAAASHYSTLASAIRGINQRPCARHCKQVEEATCCSLKQVVVRWRDSSRQRASVLCRGTPGLMNLPLDRMLEEPIPGFDSISSALKDLEAGKFVVVLDDEDRENEGDLIISADKMTTEAMHFMVEYTSGVICIAMGGKDLDRLRLPLMVSSAENEEAMYTAFTVTVDLKDGITTGISASDRTKTIRHLANPNATAAEFRRPGHIFPLRYRDGGVLVRPGHTEASVDLARLSGSFPAGVLCEIVNKADGSMARTPQLRQFARDHGLKCITIADLIRYRLQHEQLVQQQGTASIVNSQLYGPLTVYTYSSQLDGSEHVAFVAGEHTHGTSQQAPVPVYVHRDSCITDVLKSDTSNGQQLHQAMSAISAQQRGVVLYMRPRLDGQNSASPSSEMSQASSSSSNGHAEDVAGAKFCRQNMDIRSYGLAAQILKDLGITNVSLLGDDASQANALASCGIQVTKTPATAAMFKGAALNGASVNGVHTSLAGVM